MRPLGAAHNVTVKTQVPPREQNPVFLPVFRPNFSSDGRPSNVHKI